MAVVAGPPVRSPSKRRLQAGLGVIAERPWVLFIVAAGGIAGWLLQPDQTPSALARSFALPPLDLYADAPARSRGWGVFVALLIVRWATFVLLVWSLVHIRPSIQRFGKSLALYLLAALSYGVPLNLGRTFLLSSIDETSRLPALMLLVAPFVLAGLTWLFTHLLLRTLTPTRVKVGWAMPACSVVLWILGPRVLEDRDLAPLSILFALLVLSLQLIMLASLTQAPRYFSARDVRKREAQGTFRRAMDG